MCWLAGWLAGWQTRMHHHHHQCLKWKWIFIFPFSFHLIFHLFFLLQWNHKSEMLETKTTRKKWTGSFSYQIVAGHESRYIVTMDKRTQEKRHGFVWRSQQWLVLGGGPVLVWMYSHVASSDQNPVLVWLAWKGRNVKEEKHSFNGLVAWAHTSNQPQCRQQCFSPLQKPKVKCMNFIHSTAHDAHHVVWIIVVVYHNW